MTNIEETKHKVDHLLSDRGLVEDYKEQAVRLLLFHLFVAIDIYRYMTFAEKSKAGYWFRMFKGSFSLTGFLKERKRKREKKKSPLHPSYKETEPEDKEKDEKSHTHANGEMVNPEEEMKRRCNAFYQECMSFKEKYDEQLIMDFYAYWKMPNRKTWRMRFEDEEYWETEAQLYKFVNNPISKAKVAADLKLMRTKKPLASASAADSAGHRAIAAEREAADAKRERELAESKKGAVSYEEYLKMKRDAE
jgi:hypothetical protein